MLQKVLLGEKSQLLLRQLTTIFDVVLRFRAVCDRVYEQVSTQLLSEVSVDQAADIRAKLDGISSDYSTLLEGFLNLLPVQKHVDLRTLLFRLDFSVSRFFIELLCSDDNASAEDAAAPAAAQCRALRPSGSSLRRD